MKLQGTSGWLTIKRLMLTILLAGLLSLPSIAAFAQAAPTTPCDPQFMQAMEARAWLEAQREITQNENLIVKPDSVLEYSCFIGFLNKAAANFQVNGINRPFSETDAWQTIGFDTTTTDQSLTQTVALALAAYIDGNFPHQFLGGRLTIPAPKPNGMTMAAVTGGAYTCDVMAQVWEQARCQNFNAITGQDGFRDFLWYSQNDPRVLPTQLTSCKAMAGSSNLPALYTLDLNEAYNGNQNMFVLPAGVDGDPDNTRYAIDNVQSYFNLILPDACSPAYIPTGVRIFRNGASTPDGICPNPGCALTGGTCQ